MKFRRLIAILTALAMLLAATGLSEELCEAAPAEAAEEAAPAEEAQQAPEAEEAAPEDCEEALPECDEEAAPEDCGEILPEDCEEVPPEDGEEEAMPAAPEVILAPGWEYDADICAITIPYRELPETLRFDWRFDGEAAGYAVQIAPVPEGDAPEVRGERIHARESFIELPAADFAEGGWFSLYVIAILPNGSEIEGWRYFRLDRRDAQLEDEQPITPAEQLAEELGLSLEQLAEQLGKTVEEALAMTREELDAALSIDIVPEEFDVTSLGIGTEFTINGVKFSAQQIADPGTNQCWEFVNRLYAKVWSGSRFASDFSSSNMLRNLSDAQRKLTADNLKAFIGQAKLGASIRIGGCTTACKQWSNDGLSCGHKGHNVFLAAKDASGFTVIDRVNQDGEKRRVRRYTWQEFANSYGGSYPYIKYIKWPSAPAYSAVAVTGVSLNTTSASRDYSQSITLKATVSPSNASQGVVWSTSNANVARISSTSGGSIYVWAINPGTATITCASAADGSKKATCTFHVKSPSTLQLTGVDYPSTYLINTTVGWHLSYGTLASNADLKSLTSTIKNSSGGVVGSAYTKTFGSGVKRYDIKGIDSNVPFSKASSVGDYTWVLTGTDVSGRSVTMNLKFKAVKSGNQVISGASGVYAPIPVSGIALSKSSVTLNRSRGETAALTATVSPSNATNKGVSWSTSNAAVVSVSNGKITPVGKGSATITCAAADGSGKKATCQVTVTEDIPVSSVALNESSVTLNRSRGETATLTATVSPSNATNKGVSWSTSNGAVATVSNGKITPVGKGSATITCTAADGSGKKASCQVTVTEDIPVSSISLSEGELTLTTVQSARLTASVLPANATNPGVTWRSDDGEIASVSGGLVTAQGIGTTTIRCVAADGSGVSATCRVRVTKAPAPKSVSIEPKGASVSIGGTLRLVAKFSPDGSASELKWSSSNRKIATVDADGVVRGIKEGSAKITAKTQNNRKAVVSLKVVDPSKPTKVQLDRSGTVALDLGSTLRLSATLSPSTARSELKWTSSNRKIATVDGGTVTPLKPGIVTITVKTVKAGKTAKVKIQVVDPTKPARISLDPSGTIEMGKGDELGLRATIEPATAAGCKLSWSSSNKQVVAVDSDGMLTALRKGSATISVKTPNGKKASVKIRVR